MPETEETTACVRYSYSKGWCRRRNKLEAVKTNPWGGSADIISDTTTVQNSTDFLNSLGLPTDFS